MRARGVAPARSTDLAHGAARRGRVSQMSVPAKPMRLDSEPYIKLLERIDQEYPPDERGDMLIFLSGMSEISYLLDELRLYASYTKCGRGARLVWCTTSGPFSQHGVSVRRGRWKRVQALDHSAAAQRAVRGGPGEGV